MADFERIRLVILGGAGVGKSCIVKRFLFKTYSDKYRATVEDLYNREYDLGSVTLKVSLITIFDFHFHLFCYIIASRAHMRPPELTSKSHRLRTRDNAAV